MAVKKQKVYTFAKKKSSIKNDQEFIVKIILLLKNIEEQGR
jgi:hypothetical protein